MIKLGHVLHNARAQIRFSDYPVSRLCCYSQLRRETGTHTHAHTHRRRSFLNAKNISTANSFFSMSDIRKKEHSRNSSKHRQDLKQKSNYILYIFFIFYNILIVIIVDISIFCHYYYYLI